MKRCSVCKKFKSFDNFTYSSYNKDNLQSSCKKCNVIKTKIWAKNNKELKIKTHYNYSNTEKGFLVNLFNSIRKRDRNYNNRKKKLILVNLTKKEFFEEWLLHKQRFGMKCRYTGTTITHISRSGMGVQKDRIVTNISVDRIDNSLPYQVNNIVFCTGEFNDRKGSVLIDDCKKILKVYEERKLELIEDGYETQS
jgi:hypothetical protein